jgi:hypothetical protein
MVLVGGGLMVSLNAMSAGNTAFMCSFIYSKSYIKGCQIY